VLTAPLPFDVAWPAIDGKIFGSIELRLKKVTYKFVVRVHPPIFHCFTISPITFILYRLLENTHLFRPASGLRSFPIAIGIIATYCKVRLIPHDIARLASGCFGPAWEKTTFSTTRIVNYHLKFFTAHEKRLKPLRHKISPGRPAPFPVRA